MKTTISLVYAAAFGIVIAVTNLASAEPASEKVGHLGIAVAPADETLRQQLKLTRGVGLTVPEVVPDSPADKAGIKKHDLLEKLDDQWLFNGEQFGNLVRMHQAGDRVRLAIRRDGKAQTIEATLDETEIKKQQEEGPFWGPDHFRRFQQDIWRGSPYGFYWSTPKERPEANPGPFLGVEARELDPSVVAQLGLEEGRGVLVGHVVDDSPATKAGLKENDIILKIDKDDIRGPAELVKRIRARTKGATIRIEILRGGKSQSLEATLGEEEKPKRERMRNLMKRFGGTPRFQWAPQTGSNDEAVIIMDDEPLVGSPEPSRSGLTVITSPEGETTVRQDQENRVVIVKDRSGKTLFNGPIDTDAQRDKLPKAIRSEIEKIDSEVKPEASKLKPGVEEIRVVRPGSREII